MVGDGIRDDYAEHEQYDHSERGATHRSERSNVYEAPYRHGSERLQT